jgi:hypothetical protein
MDFSSFVKTEERKVEVKPLTVVTIGNTLLIIFRGTKSTMVISNVNIRGSQVRKMEKSGLNQSLIYKHLFSPLSPQFF